MAGKQSRSLQQQKIAVGVFAAVVIGILAYLVSYVIQDAPMGEFVEGDHYTLLQQPRRIRNDRVEIMEFFSYGCIHCYNFDDDLADWTEENQNNISFVRTPVFSNDQWRIYGRTYYTLEQLGILEENHVQFFREIHEARKKLDSVEKISALFATDDISEEDFLLAFNSPSVAQKAQRADELARRFKIASVPNIVVDGKYLVRATNSVGLSRMLDVMDFLVEKETAISED